MQGIISRYSNALPMRGNAQIIAVVKQIGVNTVAVTFNQPVTANANVPDGAFKVRGLTPTSTSQLDPINNPVEVDVNFGSTIASGDSWTLTAKPNWLNNQVVTGSGIVS